MDNEQKIVDENHEKILDDNYEKMLREQLRNGAPSFIIDILIYELIKIEMKKYFSNREPITFFKTTHRRNINNSKPIKPIISNKQKLMPITFDKYTHKRII